MNDVPPQSRPTPGPDPSPDPAPGFTPGPTPDPAPDPGHTRVLPPDREPGGPRQRFADRVWTLRALIAVALASVILGGLGGAALASIGDDDDRRDAPGRLHRGGPMTPEDMERWQERRREWLERHRAPSG